MQKPPITLPATDGSDNSRFVGLTSGVTSPVTQQDDFLLDNLAPGLPMDVGSGNAGLSEDFFLDFIHCTCFMLPVMFVFPINCSTSLEEDFYLDFSLCIGSNPKDHNQ